MFNENYKDILYVIQNGSLLRIDDDFESFDIYEHYCLDMDEDEGVLTAIVCEFDDMLFHVNQAQAFIFATCMLISVPVSKRYRLALKCVFIIVVELFIRPLRRTKKMFHNNSTLFSFHFVEKRKRKNKKILQMSNSTFCSKRKEKEK
jgi:hypothetical protein